MIVVSQYWVIAKRKQSVGYLLNTSTQLGCLSNIEKCPQSFFGRVIKPHVDGLLPNLPIIRSC
jgi:hypothetical protein